MSRFLSTIPTNHGFVGLDKIQSYPTGGSGPIAFGPTSYFGSDPKPPELGDNLNNPTLCVLNHLLETFHIVDYYSTFFSRQNLDL